jgi:hypothetical protein
VHSGFGRQASGLSSLIYNTALGRLFLINDEQGAAPLMYLAAVADARPINGQYFNKLTPNAATSKRARDAAFGKALWTRTEALLGLHHAEASKLADNRRAHGF